MGLKTLHSRSVQGRMWQVLTGPGPESWPGTLSGAPLDAPTGENTYAGLGSTPGLREWEGERKSTQLIARAFAIANKKYEDTLRIEGDDIRRNQIGQVDRRIADLRVRWEEHWAKLLSTLILNGGTNLGYDGVAFFSAAHTENGQANQTNLFSIAKAGALPTPAEFEAALVGAIAQTRRLKDDSGEPVMLSTNQWLIMVPPELLPVATIALKAEVILEGGQARTAVLKAFGNYRFSLVDNPYLTSTTVFYLFQMDGRAFIRQTELELKISSLGEGSEFEHKYDAQEHGILTVRGAGYGNWQSAIRITFTGP